MPEPYVPGTTTETTAPAEYWRRQVQSITDLARTILVNVEEARRIYRGNRLGEVIAATPAGAAVPGTTMSKEQAVAWAAMVDAVAGFLQQEIGEGLTIEGGLYAMWPVISAEETP